MAHWITPSAYILKGAERLLSVKIPNDDPSKPALRVNIPQEAPHSDSRSKLMHNSSFSGKNFGEPRSKSLVSRPKVPLLNPGFKEDGLPKCESESQLPQLEAEEFLMETEVSKGVSSMAPESYVAQSASETSGQENYAVAVRNEDDYHEGLSTPLHDPETGEALANSYVNNTEFAASDLTKVEAKSETAETVKNEEPDPKMLYIIVDSPEENVGKLQYKSVADSCKEEGKTPPSLVQDDFATVKILPHKIPVAKASKPKSGWQKQESGSFRKSKNFSKVPAHKSDVRQLAKRFEVQEMEDLATYVLHSRQNKDSRSKVFSVECVPEKEITTRSGSTNYNVAPIKVQGGAGKSFKGFQNEVASVEELPNFVKVPETKKRQKSRKSDGWGQRGDKAKTPTMSKYAHHSSPAPTEKNKAPVKAAVSEPSHEMDLSSQVAAPEYLHSPVDAASEKGIALSPFEKDDFGSVRSGSKPTEFKVPEQVFEANQEDRTPGEAPAAVATLETSVSTELQAETPASYSYPAAEAKPELNLTKVETVQLSVPKETSNKNETIPRSEYYSPWKDNSNDNPKASQVHFSDWVSPRPASSPGTAPVKKITGNKSKQTSKKRGKYADSEAPPEKVEAENPAGSEKNDSETDFKTSGSFVSIGCDKVTALPMKFSAAFPPLLCEALKIRGRILGFRREFLFSDKWTGRFDFTPRNLDMNSNSSQKNKMDLSENSILFPKAESEKFDCSSLFGGKDEMPLGVGNNSEEDKSPKISDNIANVANESLTETKGQPSVDSLAMMKKVKEIVEFDLENAIKIFKRVEPPEETPSVMMLVGDKWKVDTETLDMYVRMRKEAPNTFEEVEKSAQKENILGDEQNGIQIQDVPQNLPKYLPPKRESFYDMKLSDRTNSVIAFNPNSNEFFLNKKALANAIRQRADESFDDVIIQTLEGQLTKGRGNESIVMFDARDELSYEMRSGDSILVFDEETQTWKVDFSILEKREEQLRMEEELNKRSELILETFEQLEKGNISNIPMPDSKDKRMFDYTKEEWKSYPTEKNSKEKTLKSKLPFKESNAEEIRRNNSDLYENLFVGKKKETTMNRNKGNNQSDKGSKSCSSQHEKKASGSGSQKETETNESESNYPFTGPGGGKPCDPSKEDDNFWESFLKMNILPRDISEIPKIRPPPPPPPPPPPQPPSPSPSPRSQVPPPSPSPAPKKEDPKPTIPPGKIEDPRPIIPHRRIEEPRFKIHLPFIGDKGIEDSKIKIPPAETPKVEDPKKKTPEPTIGTTKQDIKIKAPAKEAPKIEDPKKKPPEPTVGPTKQDTQIKAPPKEAPKVEDPKKKPSEPTIGSTKQDPQIKAPPKEAPKIEDPKKKPSEPTIGSTKQDAQIKAPAKEAPKIEDPKKKPSGPAAGTTKEEAKIKAPTKETPKVEEPKKKPPATPSADGAAKPESKIKAPSKDVPKIEDPKKKPPGAPPSAGGDSKPESTIKAPPPSTHPKIDDPKTNKPPPTIGAPPISPKGDLTEVKAPPSSPAIKIQDPKPTTGGRKDKSAADHYISENIVEISRNTSKESPSKFKTNKIETVKLNITSEKRMPSKVTEINLNKKCEEKGKESNTALKKQTPGDPKKSPDVPSKKNEKCSVENKSFYKNFEKYKTPFSDPEYEEKSMKIKSDIESNPNLKKLDNWNKTLVLHDIGKPPENIESWLKDETDKMATLLLKVLQEAADGKPRKKPPPVKPKPGEKNGGKTNPYDCAQKKCETTPENFLFRVRTVNLSLENDKKTKPAEDRKPYQKQPPHKDGPGQLEKAGKPYKVIDPTKLFSPKEFPQANSTATLKSEHALPCTEVQKSKLSQSALESLESSSISREFEYQNILPPEIIEEVPGPEFLKKLSNAWKVFPIIGSQMTIFTLLRAFQLVNLGSSIFGSSNPEKSRANAFTKLFNKYGPIVNVQGPLSGNVILIHKPEHFISVFEQDSLAPVRSVFDSLEQSRRETEDKMLSAAISTDWSKPEWNDLKRGSTDPILKGSEKFFEPAELAGDSLINSIRKTRNMQNYVSEDFMEEIKRWSLEGMCNVMFEKSFGFLDRKNSNMNWIMEPDKLYIAVEEATNCLNKCEKGFQTWRLMSTPSSVGLGQAYRTLSAILSKQLYQAEINLKNKNELIRDRNLPIFEDLTFLEGMMLNDGMTMEEITCNLIDIILLGTNLMNSALGFLLYNLAQNLKVQNKLVEELREALPNKNSRLDYQNLYSLRYLQACLKESLRLNIPVPIFYRMLQSDVLLSNYIIPKGTYVVMDYRMTCMKDQIFDDPDKFMPERWLSEEKWMKDVHPFDTLPLCHGPRAELAKRIVEMQLSACLAKVVRNFKIEYHFGEIEGTNGLISVPDKPLKLNFIERDS